MGDLIEALRFVGRYGAESEQDAAARRIRERNEAASRIAELEALLADAGKALEQMVDRDLTYNGPCVIIPAKNHGDAIRIVREARQALASIQERT